MPREPLTPRQAEVFDLIQESLTSRGFTPTLREIGARLGLKSTNGVNDHLDRLEAKGWIRRGPATSCRTIVILAPPERHTIAVFSSLYPMITKAEIMPPHGLGQVHFGWVMRGDRLQERGVFAGDWLFVCRREPKRGEIALVKVGGSDPVAMVYHGQDFITEKIGTVVGMYRMIGGS